MGLELAKAFIRVRADSSRLGPDFSAVRKTAAAQMTKIAALVGGTLGSAVSLRALINVSREGVALAERQAEAEQRLAGVLKATGNAAGFTTEQLKRYASELQAATTIGDEEILESMAVLGTFKSVSGDVFKRTTQAAADLSAAGFGGMQQAVTQLGKALEDPIRGLGSLRRVGVSFSAAQEEQIKNLTKSGELLKAQEILLVAVEGQVKGTAAAIAETPTGKLAQLNNKLGDIKEQLGQAVLPLFIKMREFQIVVVQKLVGVVKWLQVLATNWKTVWELMVASAALQITRVFDFFKNTFFAIPTIARASFNGILASLKTWGDFMMNMFSNIMEFFKVGFMGLRDAWNALWSDESVLGAMQEAGKKQLAILEKQAAEFMDVIPDSMRASNEAIQRTIDQAGGLDFFKESDAAKLIQKDIDRLASKLTEARAALDQPAEAEEIGKSIGNTAAEMIEKAKVGFESGRFGIAEFGRKAQEVALKGDDKEGKMVSLLQFGNNVQQQMLKELQKANQAEVGPNTNFGLV